MSLNPILPLLTVVMSLLSTPCLTQNNSKTKSVPTKDLVEHLYDQHVISFELKLNKKKGMVFVDYLSDGIYNYEITLVDRSPIRIIDPEDIFKITLMDTTKLENVLQNVFDKGINDRQDFDKNTITEFSKIVSGKPAINLIPVYSFEELKRKVFILQEEKLSASKD